MEMVANTKNIRRAVKREAERIDLLPRLSFREVALHFVLLTQEFWKAKTCVIGAVFCSETLTTYKRLVTNQEEFFTKSAHQQTEFVCVVRQCADQR
jgi:hypothetical protein